MRRLAYLLVLMSVTLAACGSPVQAANDPSAPGAAGPAAASDSQSELQSQSEAASTPAAETETLSDGEVIIQLGDNTIDSSQTTFKAGVLYRFHITNYGERPHDFYINEPVSIKGSYLGAMNGAMLSVAKINPGQTVTVEFTFPTNATRKQWEFSSLTKNMYEDGMRWAIAVVI